MSPSAGDVMSPSAIPLRAKRRKAASPQRQMEAWSPKAKGRMASKRGSAAGPVVIVEPLPQPSPSGGRGSHPNTPGTGTPQKRRASGSFGASAASQSPRRVFKGPGRAPEPGSAQSPRCGSPSASRRSASPSAVITIERQMGAERQDPLRALVQDLAALNDRMNGNSAPCMRCGVRDRAVVFEPCQHWVCCVKCGMDRTVKACPACSTPIAARVMDEPSAGGPGDQRARRLTAGSAAMAS